MEKALDEIYQIYNPLHLLNPIGKHRKTTRSASAKHHPGSEAWREEMKNVQRAPCAGSASENCTDLKNESLRCGAHCGVYASVNCTDSKDDIIAMLRNR